MIADIIKDKLSKYNFIKVISEKERGHALLDVVIAFPHDKNLSAADREDIKQVIVANVPEKDVKVDFKKSYLDDTILKDAVKSYMDDNFFAISDMVLVTDAKFDEGNASVVFTIVCDNLVKDYVIESKLKEKMLEYFESQYHYTFDIDIKFDDLEKNENNEVLDFEIEDTSHYKPRVIEVTNVEKLLGDKIILQPMYIEDIQSIADGVCICGKVLHFVENMTKEKRDDNGKIKPARPYFKWVMEDFTGKINVVSFCSETNLPRIRKIADGSQLIMVGDVKADGFSGGLIFRPKHISFCELPKHFEEVINYRPVPEHYHAVKVEPAQVINQMDLFNYQSRMLPEYILTHTIVVYDFETSGLSSASDSVIEIGAIKIEKGEYTESFQTFVHLDHPLPQEITEITSITDKDLQDAPIEEIVFADFYKFCDGAVLCGYNSDNFDLQFLKRIWKNYRFEFKHETLDCYKLATKVVHGLKKYTLISVADHLKIQLSNAHRALADATATAEVLMTIAKDVL